MKLLVYLLFMVSLSIGRELTLGEAIELALKNNRLIASARKDIKAQELELRAVRGSLFPRIKLEETFTRTDMPAYAFMSKLNQERIGPQDFNPARLNDPSAVNNFETKFTIEIPIWLGGKIQSANRISEHEYKAVSLEAKRREEEVIRQVYQAYMDAVLAKEAIRVSQKAVEDATEHARLAESMRSVGMALLSDVLRAKVHLSKAEEHLKRAQKDYHIAKKALELVMGVSLGEFEVVEIGGCPELRVEGLKDRAVNRSDIKAVEQRLKSLEEAYRLTLSDNLPQIYAFAQYALHSKNLPLGTDGTGYMVGLSLSWSFETGMTTLRKAQANLERRSSLEERLKLLRDSAVFEVDRALSEYEKAMNSLKSAEDRIKASGEVLRVMEIRYKNGLARMVDVLDAQTELDNARFERLQAIKACHKAYIDILFSAGMTEEVKR
ncbi:MAG: TolC family protein [Aquificaceae bacterium]|nr:TolC family protein [Aquificaceae bacterium]